MAKYGWSESNQMRAQKRADKRIVRCPGKRLNESIVTPGKGACRIRRDARGICHEWEQVGNDSDLRGNMSYAILIVVVVFVCAAISLVVMAGGTL